VEEEDDELLQSLGYNPELHRVLGFFTNFGTSFSIISILTGLGGKWKTKRISPADTASAAAITQG